MRPRAFKAALLGLAVVLVGSCGPVLAGLGGASPGPGWPDLADPPVGRTDGHGDAALIVVIDDPELGGRSGAWALGSGWWRYLVHTRGLPRSRVRMLRNADAGARAITDAVTRLENQADSGAMLWMIWIGAGESPSEGHDGRLRAGDGSFVELAPIRAALSVGRQQSAFLLLDACSDAPSPGYRAGLPAKPAGYVAPTQLPPAPAAEPQHAGYASGYLTEFARIREQALADLERSRTTPRNSFMLTAGTGEGCASELAGRSWPALAYAALGGLQGWADIDEDGWVGARELSIYAQSLITSELDEPARSQLELEAAGVDIILADIAGKAPHPPRVAWRRRRVATPDPGLARQSDAALRVAESEVELALEDMLAVPRGDFFMGCDRDNDEACEGDEYPAHNVELGGYAIDRTEVTWADYRACMASGACDPLHLEVCWVWTGDAFVRGAELPPEMLADDHPVSCVSWPEAARYCESVGKRLPTEAEWERAARGVDGRLYPWGNEPPSCATAVMDGCSDFTHAVASHPAGASPVGAQDMAGNVAEWVWDWWDERSYPRRLIDNPTGPERGRVRGVRGGSFYNADADLRVSYRYGLEPNARLSIVGFRCAR